MVLQDKRLVPQDNRDQKLISLNRTLRRTLRPEKSICMLDRIFKLSAPLQKSYVVIDEAFTPSGTQNRALDAVRPFRSKVDL